MRILFATLVCAGCSTGRTDPLPSSGGVSPTMLDPSSVGEESGGWFLEQFEEESLASEENAIIVCGVCIAELLDDPVGDWDGTRAQAAMELGERIVDSDDTLGVFYLTILNLLRAENEAEREVGWRMFATAYVTMGMSNIYDCRIFNLVLGGQAWFQDQLVQDEEAQNTDLAQAASEAHNILRVFGHPPEYR